jgi:ribosomal protein S18 acetylase RimI-like enzyme
MNEIIIKEAGKNDATLIADISRQTFYDTFAAHNTSANMNKFMDEQFSRQKLMDEVGAPGNTFLMAYSNDEVAGYVRLKDFSTEFLPDTRAIEIARIYAVQSSIGKGVGRALMEHCLTIARQRNKQTIWLGVWEKNQRAIDFYTKWGFEKFGEHVFMLGDDAQIDWLMKKVIG